MKSRFKVQGKGKIRAFSQQVGVAQGGGWVRFAAGKKRSSAAWSRVPPTDHVGRLHHRQDFGALVFWSVNLDPLTPSPASFLRPKHPVADRVGNVEVLVRHQVLAVVGVVEAAQAVEDGHFEQGGIIGQVVGQV